MTTLVCLVVVLLGVIPRVHAVAPVFTTPNPDRSNLYLDEDKKGNDIIAILAATDADTDNNSLVFSMDKSPRWTKELFEVNIRTLRVKSTVPAGYFDYEKYDAIWAYTIILQVTDGTYTTTLKSVLSIRDINETPVFSGSPPYKASVGQSSPPGKTVYKVVATDVDFENTITYGLTGASQFEINPRTGVIRVTSGTVFNKTTTPQYSVTVTATDNGDPILSVSAIIRFNIVIRPTISPSTPTNVTVNENAAIGTSVFTLDVVDEDTPSDSIILWIRRQTPNTPTNMFKLENRVLKTNKDAFNAEVQRTYALEFLVTDRTFVVASATLTVNVNDLNDNFPVITPVRPITIPETKPLGTAVVVDVDATDADISSPNNLLTYAIISGNSATTFAIVPSTGVIYLLKAPLLSRYTLKIRVTDGATPPLSSEIDIIVNVKDVINECVVNPCLNGASCTPSLNSYSCTCATGYSGTTCQTNIDDCANTPCKNQGTCIDLVNSFRCNCAVGYKGTTCEEVCTDNDKYVSGCSQTCNCNASRLVENVGTQACNQTTGYCTCNAKWTGPACETDVDECTDTTICNSTPNKVCENTLDGYYCTCKVGYTENTDKTCRASTTTVSLSVGANEYKITLKMTLDIPCVAADLQVPTKYDRIKASIESMLQAKLSSTLRVVAYNIMCGSIVFESQIIILNTDAEKSRVAGDLQNIRNGDTVAVDGINTKATALTVNGYALSITSGTDNTGTEVCRVHSTLVTCPTGQTCQYVDNTASCRTIQTDEADDDNNAFILVLGLGLGLGLPLVLFVIIAVACCYWAYNRRQYREKDYRRDRDIPSSISNVVDRKDDYRRSYDRPRNDYDGYIDKKEFYGLPT